MPIDPVTEKTALVLFALFEAGYTRVIIKDGTWCGTRVICLGPKGHQIYTSSKMVAGAGTGAAQKAWDILETYGVPWSCASYSMSKNPSGLLVKGIYCKEDYSELFDPLEQPSTLEDLLCIGKTSRSGATMYEDELPPTQASTQRHQPSQRFYRAGTGAGRAVAGFVQPGTRQIQAPAVVVESEDFFTYENAEVVVATLTPTQAWLAELQSHGR